MFKHIYFNMVKMFVREKDLIFWLLAFPIILSIFFKAAFSGIGADEKFEIIPVAAIEWEENTDGELYGAILEQLTDVMDIKYMDDEEAQEKLMSQKVDAKIYVKDGRLEMTVRESGLNQSIVKSVLDKINETVDLVRTGKIQPEEIGSVLKTENFLNNVSISNKEQDVVITFYFTILGMAAAYGSIIGVEVIRLIQASHSANAMRFSLAPISKMKGFGAVFGAGITIQTIILVLVYLYLRYIMNIDFGDRVPYIILNTILGGISGVSMGALISVIVKKNDEFKTGICLVVSMLGSYLAGMMDESVKYKVMQSAPFIEKINPVGIVTDSYLKLYYYEDLSYFWDNVINLLVIIGICMAVTILALRRQRYDSV